MNRHWSIRVVGRASIFAATLVLLVGGAYFLSRLVRLALNAGFNLEPGAALGVEVGGVIFETVLFSPLVVWWVVRYRQIVSKSQRR